MGTIDDYARFCQMLLNGGQLEGVRILSAPTVALMLRNHIGDLEVWDRKDKFGLGVQLITEESHYGDQATPGSVTWGGMYCSEYTIDPAEELVMLVYFNVHLIAEYSELVRKFRILVYAGLGRLSDSTAKADSFEEKIVKLRNVVTFRTNLVE